MITDGIDYKKVFYYFEKISQIPRGSGNVTRISNYLVDFAKEHHLKYVQDEAENVIIYKDGTKGKENLPAVILQGHMDMVCEKVPGSKHDFRKDPISLVIDGDNLRADGTTLGGDDGVAVAYGLAILDSEEIPHPPLEVVFTTDEETGMDGAVALDMSLLSGKYMINIDSEEEGTILVGSAGGKTVAVDFPVEREIQPEGEMHVKLEVSGLLGGHSGVDIDKDRVNATRLMARLLLDLKKKGIACRICQLEGGKKDNVIPSVSSAVVSADQNVVPELEQAVQELSSVYAKENSFNEPELKICAEPVSSSDVPAPLTPESERRLLLFITHTPSGVQRMNPSIPDVVETSVNLGITELKKDSCLLDFSIRSSLSSTKEAVADRISELAEYLGAVVTEKAGYPAWEYHGDSEFTELCRKVYVKQYGEEPVLTVIHAGLECSFFAEKRPDLQIVSIGAETVDIHSPKERLSISSTKRVFDYILSILDKIS